MTKNKIRILSVDPGTKCGYALSPFESGVWNLSVSRHEGGGMRFIKLRNYLIKACEGIEILVYEEVRSHKGTDAAQIYGGIIAIIQEQCELKEISYQGVSVGTIKKFATGKGNSNKEVMLSAARKRWPEIDIIDDNQADALFLWAWAVKEYVSEEGK